MSWFTGIVTFSEELTQLSQWRASSTLAAIFVVLSIAILSSFTRSSSSDDKIHGLNGFYFFTAWSFFSTRYDFLRKNFKKTGLNMFHFRIFQYRVIAMAGEENRKIFFSKRSFDIVKGYRVLSWGQPLLRDIDLDVSKATTGIELVKQISYLLRQERVMEGAPLYYVFAASTNASASVLPLFLEDVNRRMKDWGIEGKIDPFNEVRDLVFQMNIRFATCSALSEDRAAVNRLANIFRDIEKNTSPISSLLPWFPTLGKKPRQMATKALHSTLLSYVDLQRKASTSSMEPIDFFISQGMSDDIVVGMIVNIIFAGLVNTGVNSCWALLHLGANPKWKRKAIDEYKALVDKHVSMTSSNPLHMRLSTIPLDAWEDELPSLDLIIRETLRISGSTTVLRLNEGKDVQVGEATIKQGDLLAYSIADVNLNPNIYTNPMMFDPDRYGPDREEDRKRPFGYLAWGAGVHPCAGMKIAKLWIKIVLAMTLLGYEFELVDDNGNHAKTVPNQNRNSLRQVPIGDPCYIKYKRVVE